MEPENKDWDDRVSDLLSDLSHDLGNGHPLADVLSDNLKSHGFTPHPGEQGEEGGGERPLQKEIDSLKESKKNLEMIDHTTFLTLEAHSTAKQMAIADLLEDIDQTIKAFDATPPTAINNTISSGPLTTGYMTLVPGKVSVDRTDLEGVLQMVDWGSVNGGNRFAELDRLRAALEQSQTTKEGK